MHRTWWSYTVRSEILKFRVIPHNFNFQRRFKVFLHYSNKKPALAYGDRTLLSPIEKEKQEIHSPEALYHWSGFSSFRALILPGFHFLVICITPLVREWLLHPFPVSVGHFRSSQLVFPFYLWRNRTCVRKLLKLQVLGVAMNSIHRTHAFHI